MTEQAQPGYLASLQAQSKEWLVDWVYNAWLAELADFAQGDEPEWEETHGKRIPYLGWAWCDVDFAERRIPIGKSESGYVAVMESNKWAYPGRMMTEEEAETFIRFLDTAYVQRQAVNDQGAGKREAERTFAEMRRWFQTLKVEEGDGG